MNALGVVREIIERHGLFDAAFTLLAHPTAPGWRERHRTIEQRIVHSLDDLIENGWARFSVSGKELAGASMDDLDRYRAGDNDLLSLCSRLHLADGAVRHLPLMDLATEEFIPNTRLTEAIRSLCGGRQFWLLRTDRHHHVYGNFTMDEAEWLRWNASFQMSAVLVDAHYVGRSLHLGYNALRLNAGAVYQKVIPATVHADPDEGHRTMAERAVRLARRRQSGQFRASGEPTLHHLHEVACLAVAILLDCVERMPELRDVATDDLYACGYLHDIIEDSATDFEDVEQAASPVIAEWVRTLSVDKRMPKWDRYAAYERQIQSAVEAVQIVKLADLLSNLRGIRGSEDADWLEHYLDTSDRHLALLRDVLHETRWFCEARQHIARWRQWLQRDGA